MKRFTKIMLSAGGALLIGSGAVMNYLKVQQEQPESDLTLANIEIIGKGGSVDIQGGCSGSDGNCYVGKCGICKTPIGNDGPGYWSGSHSCRIW